MKIRDFEIVVCSDPDYEDLVAEVSYQGEFLFLVSQDQGLDEAEIEVHARGDTLPWRLRLGELEQVLEAVKSRLFDLRRDEDDSE